LGYPTSVINMIVLKHDHVEQTESMIVTSTNSYRPFFQKT
jgi:hypothetical protein